MNWNQLTVLTSPSQEDWFDFWADDLVKATFINKVLKQDIKGWEIYPGEKLEYEEPKILYEGTDRERVKMVKKSYTLHRPVHYTPDRVIFWNPKAEGIFFTDVEKIVLGEVKYFIAHKLPDGRFITVLDVKSPFGGMNSSDVSFSIKKKWVWVKERIYVNQAVMHPVKPLKNVNKYLWVMTFTPNRFLYTDKLSTRKNKPVPYRTIPNKKGVPNWEVRTLAEFITAKNPLL